MEFGEGQGQINSRTLCQTTLVLKSEGEQREAQAERSGFDSLKYCGEERCRPEIQKGVELPERSRNPHEDHTSLSSTLHEDLECVTFKMTESPSQLLIKAGL